MDDYLAPSPRPNCTRRRATRAAARSLRLTATSGRARRAPARVPSVLITLAVLAAALGSAVFAPTVHAQSPYPPRRGFVADGSGSLGVDESAQLTRDFAERIGERYALEGIVIIVDDCRPAPDPYYDGALVHYGLAPRPGEMVDDAVAFFLCLDLGHAGFSYAVGNAYGGFLDPIRVERAVAPLVVGGDVGAAIEAGLDAVADDLSNAPPGRGGYVPAAMAAATPAPSGPDLAETDGLPGRLLALGLGAALLALWAWSRAGDRRTAPAAGGATPEPVTVRRVSARVEALDGRLVGDSPALTTLMSRVESLGGDTLLELDRRHQGMVERFRELRRRLEARAQAPTALATQDDGRDSAGRLEELLAEAEALHAYVEQLDRESEHAKELEEEAEERVAAASGAIAAERAAYERALPALAGRAALALPSADEAFALPERLWGRADTLVDEALLPAARHAEDASDIARRIARAATALRTADDRLDAAVAAFREIAPYADATWSDVVGDGSEAEASLALAAAMLRALLGAQDGAREGARASAGDGVQDGAQAGTPSGTRTGAQTGAQSRASDPALVAALHLGRATREIDRARALASGLVARAALLAHLARESESEITGLDAQLGILGGAESEPGRRAAALRDEARAALGAAQPDPVLARAALREADRALDALPGRDVHGLRRRRLRSLRRWAEATVEHAARYQDVHAADLGRRAATRLDEARTARWAARQALRAGGAEGIEAWERVARIAADALAIAREDVARRDARRTAWADRATWAGPVAPPPAPPRRAPFPGRFGDWGATRDPGQPLRKGRWGGRPPSGEVEPRVEQDGW